MLRSSACRHVEVRGGQFWKAADTPASASARSQGGFYAFQQGRCALKEGRLIPTTPTFEEEKMEAPKLVPRF